MCPTCSIAPCQFAAQTSSSASLHVDGQRLFDQQVNAVPQQIHADRMVQAGGGRDDGRVDLADQVAVVCHRRCAGFGCRVAARFGDRIGNRDELRTLDICEQTRVDPAEMTAADHRQLDGLHAALLRSRARPCLPSCCSWMKLKQGVDVRHELIVGAEDFAGMVEPDLRAIDQPMRLGQAMDRFGREVVALQGHDVDAPRPRRLPFAQHVRRHVVQHAADAGGERIAADRRVMMHGHAAGERGMIVHAHVPAQKRCVGDDDVAAQPAIVGDVGAGHEKVVAADDRHALFFFGRAIDRDRFANHIVIADDHLRVAAAIAHVLRMAADHDAGKQMVVLAERHAAHQGHVVLQPRAAADPYVRTDHAERTDLDFVVDLSPWIDRCLIGNVLDHRPGPAFITPSADGARFVHIP